MKNMRPTTLQVISLLPPPSFLKQQEDNLADERRKISLAAYKSEQ